MIWGNRRFQAKKRRTDHFLCRRQFDVGEKPPKLSHFDPTLARKSRTGRSIELAISPRSTPLARGCSAAPGLLSGCTPSRRFREPCSIDVRVKCPLFYACSFFVFTVRNQCIFSRCWVKPFIFDFAPVPDCLQVRVCSFFGACLFVRVPRPRRGCLPVIVVFCVPGLRPVGLNIYSRKAEAKRTHRYQHTHKHDRRFGEGKPHQNNN